MSSFSSKKKKIIMSSGIFCGAKLVVPPLPSSSSSSSFYFNTFFIKRKGPGLDYWDFTVPCNNNNNNRNGFNLKRRRGVGAIQASSDVVSPSFWDNSKPSKAAASSSTASFSDILWPSAGAFVAMAILGKMDQLLAPKGLSITLAPLGAVSALLFASPSAPSAQKYSMLMAQIGCAAIGVLAFTIFGPGLLAKSASVAACVAYMIYTDTVHPPAVAMPLLFIDGVKLQHLSFWYALYPGATGCILLCFIQEVVLYFKQKFKF